MKQTCCSVGFTGRSTAYPNHGARLDLGGPEAPAVSCSEVANVALQAEIRIQDHSGKIDENALG